MMTQSQPGIWITDPNAYQDKLQSLLGDRDPIEVMSGTADVLEKIVKARPASVMRARPFPGKWTPNEIIGHLVDAEWVFGFRLRLILSEEKPTIVGMDQELWVDRLHHQDREPPDLVESFRALRQENLLVWREMSSRDLERTGKHNERGSESLGLMMCMCAGHDLSHIDQITRYLDAGQS